jgi:CRP/FNR family cyclic AMP-dependent transcriptional regulator
MATPLSASLLSSYGLLGARTEASRSGGFESDSRGERMMENKVWYLRQNRLFDHAGDATVDDSQHLFKTCLFPKRALVFDQGDPTRLVYLIKRGKIRITRLTPDGKDVTVAVLGAGDLFGEETLFDHQPRTTYAVCLEESLLCTAKADDLFALLSRDPILALNVANILSDKLLDASATMEDLAYAKVPDRIMHLFERLANEHGVESPTGTTLDVRLTHADIASLIGSTRETVSLELSILAKNGRIAYDGKQITLPR